MQVNNSIDIKEKYDLCTQKYDDAKKKSEYEELKKEFESFGDYEYAKDFVQLCDSNIKKIKKRKIIMVSVATICIVVALIVGVLVTISVSTSYSIKSAKAEREKKNYQKAISILDGALVKNDENKKLKKEYIKEYFKYLKRENRFEDAYQVAKKYHLKDIIEDDDYDSNYDEYDDSIMSFDEWKDYLMEEEYSSENYEKLYDIASACDNKRYQFVSKVLSEKWGFEKTIENFPFNTVTAKDVKLIGEYFVKEGKLKDSGEVSTGSVELTSNHFYGFKRKGKLFGFDYSFHTSDTDGYPEDEDLIKCIYIDIDHDVITDNHSIKNWSDKWIKEIKKQFGVKNSEIKTKDQHLEKVYNFEKNGKKFSYIKEFVRKKGKDDCYNAQLIIDTEYHKHTIE